MMKTLQETTQKFAFIVSTVLLVTNVGCEGRFSARSHSVKLDSASVRITATVRKIEDLPVCDVTSKGLAGYVSPVDAFVKCNGIRWREVTPGDTNFSYVARSPIRYYEWEDSIAKKRWFIPLEGEVLADGLESKACANGWKLPTKQELMAASMNGLLQGIKSHGGRFFEKAWTTDFETIDGVTQRVAINLAAKVEAAATEQRAAGVYCVSFAGN